MSEKRTCPVCGAVSDTPAGPRCDSCGFPFAFVTAFSSPESLAFWREQVERNAMPPLLLIQARLADRLFVGPNTVGICLEDACYTVDGVYGTTLRETEVTQVSVGAHHTVKLLRGGKLTAQGKNDLSQCDVDSIADAIQVIAADDCTFALRQGGTVVQVGGVDTKYARSGRTEGVAILPEMRDVIRISSDGTSLAGLTSDGRILVWFTSLTVGFFYSADLSQIRKVSAAKGVAMGPGYRILVLLEDGTVRRFNGSLPDEGDLSGWTNVSSVAADSAYSVGLTMDGHVLLAGKKQSALLDAGRSQAASWENVAAITCGHGMIAAVTADGRLLLAGNIPRRQELLDAWERDVRPAVIRAIRGQS